VCIRMYDEHVRDGIVIGFLKKFLKYFTFLFMRETIRVVLALLTLKQGKSGHVQEKGFSWTLGNAESLLKRRRGRE
jgi:hypothetical protein